MRPGRWVLPHGGRHPAVARLVPRRGRVGGRARWPRSSVRKDGGLFGLLAAVFGAGIATGYPVAQRAAWWVVVAAVALTVLTLVACGRPQPDLRPAVRGGADGARACGDGRQRVGARGPAQAVGHRPVHVRQRAPAAGAGWRAGAARRASSRASARTGSPLTRQLDRRAEGVCLGPARARPPAGARATTPRGPTHQGRELFRALCSACHTIDGYLAIRPLVRGKSPGGAGRHARPAGLSGRRRGQRRRRGTRRPLQLKTWRSRRMPPFVGTDEERQTAGGVPGAARRGGAVRAQPAGAVARTSGKAYYDANCAACHGPDGLAPFDHDGPQARGASTR